MKENLFQPKLPLEESAEEKAFCGLSFYYQWANPQVINQLVFFRHLTLSFQTWQAPGSTTKTLF